jgi:hypothetical protein
MDSIVKDKIGSTRTRWEMAIKDKAYASIRDLPILETRADHFLKVMSIGKVATNACLRRLHNYPSLRFAIQCSAAIAAENVLLQYVEIAP